MYKGGTEAKGSCKFITVDGENKDFRQVARWCVRIACCPNTPLIFDFPLRVYFNTLGSNSAVLYSTVFS